MSCKQLDEIKDPPSVSKSTDVELSKNVTESQIDNSAEEKPNASSNKEAISWEEITSDGIDEELLIKSINKANLEYVETEFQELTENTDEKVKQVSFSDREL